MRDLTDWAACGVSTLPSLQPFYSIRDPASGRTHLTRNNRCMYQAVWANGINIGEPHALCDVLNQAGLMAVF